MTGDPSHAAASVPGAAAALSQSGRRRFDNSGYPQIVLAAAALPPARTRDSGLRHPAVITDEFDADFAKLKDAGAEALNEPEIRGGNRVVFSRARHQGMARLV